MRNTTIRRIIVGVAAATTMLVALGSPAGADTGNITSGEVRFHTAGNALTPTHLMPIPANPDPCSPSLPTGQIDLVTTGTNTSGTWTATTPTPFSSVINIPLAGATRIDFTFVTASGTYSDTGAPTGYTHSLASTDPHIVIEAKMYDINGSDCGTDDLECTVRARVLLTADSGFNGTLPGASGGETARFAATSDTTDGIALVPLVCAPPYVAVGGLDVTMVLDTTFP